MEIFKSPFTTFIHSFIHTISKTGIDAPCYLPATIHPFFVIKFYVECSMNAHAHLNSQLIRCQDGSGDQADPDDRHREFGLRNEAQCGQYG